MSNYESLRAKIIKYVPEIEELKFGCRIEWNGYSDKLQVIEKTTDDMIWVRISDNDSWFDRIDKVNNYEIKIIGRDITLEDVLRCIGEMEDQNKLGDYIIGGQFFTILNNEADDYEELFSWKLGKPLHEQSEETIKELNNIIK